MLPQDCETVQYPSNVLKNYAGYCAIHNVTTRYDKNGNFSWSEGNTLTPDEEKKLIERYNKAGIRNVKTN